MLELAFGLTFFVLGVTHVVAWVATDSPEPTRGVFIARRVHAVTGVGIVAMFIIGLRMTSSVVPLVGS